MAEDLHGETKTTMKYLKYPLMFFFSQIDEFTKQMSDIKLALFLIGGDYLNYV